MLLVDTSELVPHTQRQLHAAWQELHGRHLCSPPTVAFELAPRGINSLGIDKHPDPIALVERTRASQLPSPTVEAERRHPSYPVRGAGLPVGGNPGGPGGRTPGPIH